MASRRERGRFRRRGIALDIPDALFIEYEWVEDEKAYREALIPAEDINAHLATARKLSQEDEDRLAADR